MKTILTLLLITQISYSQLHKEYDKQLHFISGAAVSAITYNAVYLRTKDKKKASIYSFLTSVAVGTLIEIADSKQPLNYFDGRDLLYTGYGGLSVSLTFPLIKTKNKKK